MSTCHFCRFNISKLDRGVSDYLSLVKKEFSENINIFKQVNHPKKHENNPGHRQRGT